MIRAYGSQIVRGDGGRIKIRPYNMIRAYGSQWRHLKKCQLSLTPFLKHAKILIKKVFSVPSVFSVVKNDCAEIVSSVSEMLTADGNNESVIGCPK